ncbi:transcriptional regulator NanR [Rhodobacter calidifons]|uniref:Transcriptional regulator NanR n=1 Tax=Rhodobacter calidifons TaxID=2715277 RepID=A0ABX0G365_9RHOB|nr:transcriptional regulator NanR [Rhodobacter calidifons]NHB75397.1 transcriptional regulator NanR [Rhodobacter calidifons]
MMKEPIERRRLYQEVMDRIIAMIEDEGLRPGDPLPAERELSERYCVGRPAVREALQNMARMGLIRLTQGERAKVAAPTFANLLNSMSLTTSGILRSSGHGLDHLKEARLLFEVNMVRLAVERATPEDIEKLEQRFNDQQNSLPDMVQFVNCDMLFHSEIARITRNSIFPALSEAMFGWLAEFYTHLVRVPGTEQLTLQEHAAILAAIKARDSIRAERAMTEHLTRANTLYQRFAERQVSAGASEPRSQGS